MADRQEQLLACAEAVAKLAKHRQIEAVHVRYVKHDLEIRPVLATVVRRWTLLTRPSFDSTAAIIRGANLHREHVLPVRVLVDRMIMDPSECRALLKQAVIIARVTPPEHRQLGGIYTDYPDLYRQMLTAPVSQLPELGKERYQRKGIELQSTSVAPRP